MNNVIYYCLNNWLIAVIWWRKRFAKYLDWFNSINLYAVPLNSMGYQRKCLRRKHLAWGWIPNTAESVGIAVCRGVGLEWSISAFSGPRVRNWWLFLGLHRHGIDYRSVSKISMRTYVSKCLAIFIIHYNYPSQRMESIRCAFRGPRNHLA